MKLFKKFIKRIDDDFGYDNEKLARDLQKIAEEHQALQLQQTDVVGRSEQLPCDECVDGQRWSPYYAKYVECDCRK